MLNKGQEGEKQAAVTNLTHYASLEEAQERDSQSEQDDDLEEPSIDQKIETLCRKTIATYNDTFKSDILELDQSIDEE